MSLRSIVFALGLAGCGPYDQVILDTGAHSAASVVPAECRVTHAFASYDAAHTIYQCTDTTCLYVYAPRSGAGVVKEVPCVY